MQATRARLTGRRTQRSDDGFTLIELLIVIVILAILAAIVVFAVQNMTSSSAKAACRSDFKNVESAVETYKAQMGAYPLGGVATTVISGPGGTNNLSNASPGFASGNPPAGINAAAIAGPLMTGSDTAPNAKSPSGSPLGPWMKDTPVNTGHYTIWVTNDGNGTIQVLDSGGKVPVGALTHSASDCNSIS